MTRRELNAVRRLSKRQAAYEEELGLLEPRVVRPLNDNPSRAHYSSQVERLTIRKVELEKAMRTLQGEIIRWKERIDAQLRQISAPLAYKVMYLRYVECYSFREIAHLLKQPLAKIYRIHNENEKKVLD